MKNIILLLFTIILYSCNRESLNTTDECINIIDNTAEFDRLEFSPNSNFPKGSPFRRTWFSVPESVTVQFLFGEDYYYDYCPDNCEDNDDWNKSWGLTIRNPVNSNSDAAMPADKIATGDTLITLGFYYHDVINYSLTDQEEEGACLTRYFSEKEGRLKVNRCELLEFTIELDRVEDRYLMSITSFDQDTTVYDTVYWCNEPRVVREILRYHGGNQNPTQDYNVYIRK